MQGGVLVREQLNLRGKKRVGSTQNRSERGNGRRLQERLGVYIRCGLGRLENVRMNKKKVVRFNHVCEEDHKFTQPGAKRNRLLQTDELFSKVREGAFRGYGWRELLMRENVWKKNRCEIQPLRGAAHQPTKKVYVVWWGSSETES